MKKLLVLAVLLVGGCGEHIPTPPTVIITVDPPQQIRGVAVNQSTIRLQWSAPAAATDSAFAGYIIAHSTSNDTIGPSSLHYVADSLFPGVVTFMLYSLLTSGQRSDGAIFRWATAERFDTTYSIFENNSLNSGRLEGVNVGTRTTNPSLMAIDPGSPGVVQTMDFYVHGGSGQIPAPLALWSANLFLGTMNQTLFSTVTHPSSSLDLPLTSFPEPGTFAKDSISLIDNTIYYARVIGDPQEVNYVRIHVRQQPNTQFPNRVILLQISLQRLPGTLYAMYDDRTQHRFLIRELMRTGTIPLLRAFKS
jgi:hypothetical protein